jgi:uncharacterized membrane protein
MSLTAFGLTVLAGLIHAGWNIVAKMAGGDARFAFFSAFIIMLLWAPLGWWVGRDVVPTWGRAEWTLVVASGVLHVICYFTLLRGYRIADLTAVYPLARGSGPLLSSMVAIVFPGERLSALWRKQWKPALVVAAISPVASVPVLCAIQQAPLSHVAPAREMPMLIAVLIGGQLLGEGERGLRILGAVCMASGVAALGLG